jgi:hypothetical protein
MKSLKVSVVVLALILVSHNFAGENPLFKARQALSYYSSIQQSLQKKVELHSEMNDEDFYADLEASHQKILSVLDREISTEKREEVREDLEYAKTRFLKYSTKQRQMTKEVLVGLEAKSMIQIQMVMDILTAFIADNTMTRTAMYYYNVDGVEAPAETTVDSVDFDLGYDEASVESLVKLGCGLNGLFSKEDNAAAMNLPLLAISLTSDLLDSVKSNELL